MGRFELLRDLFVWAYERSTQEYLAIKQERESVQALIIEELRRLHEGVLARYGLRPSELERWKLFNAG